MKLAKDKHLLAYAGNIAFHSLFAIFPSLIALLWLLTSFHASPLVDALVGVVTTALPDPAGRALHQQLSALPGGHAGATFTIGALACLVVSTFAATAAFRATMEALNVIHGVRESRPVWLQYLTSLGLALIWTLLFVGALCLVLLGSGLGRNLAKATGLGIAFQVTWLAVIWLALLALALSAFSLIYYLGPDIQERFRWISRGSVAGALLWLLFTWLFDLYTRLVNYGAVYGSLAGIAVLMLYVYANACILVLGGAINKTLDEHDSNAGGSRRAAARFPRR